jgi:hypothetical protein
MVITMSKVRSLILLTSLSLSSSLWAENYLDTQPDLNDNPSQLQAIPLLQSLKNINQKQAFQAPFIHDLNNPTKFALYLLKPVIYLWSIFN